MPRHTVLCLRTDSLPWRCNGLERVTQRYAASEVVRIESKFSRFSWSTSCNRSPCTTPHNRGVVPTVESTLPSMPSSGKPVSRDWSPKAKNYGTKSSQPPFSPPTYPRTPAIHHRPRPTETENDLAKHADVEVNQTHRCPEGEILLAPASTPAWGTMRSLPSGVFWCFARAEHDASAQIGVYEGQRHGHGLFHVTACQRVRQL